MAENGKTSLFFSMPSATQPLVEAMFNLLVLLGKG
jgi:hypothetical protein